MTHFKGKVALITGATSGIGLAAAKLLAAHNATVIGCGLDSGIDLQTRNSDPRSCFADLQKADVTSEDAIARVTDQAAAQFGGLDILITSAGIQRYGTAADTTAALWDEVFNVNVRGTFLAAKHAIPHLRARGGGAIVAVSSIQAFMNQAGVAAYAASKGAVNALIRSIAVDEAAHGIRANAVCPASVDTPMLRASARMFSDGTEQGADSLVSDWGHMHPAGRVARPEEVAEVIAYLASSHSSFITGTAVPVDGGMLASAPVVLPS